MEYLDGVRGIAALMVVACHFANYYWPENYSSYEVLSKANSVFTFISYTPINIIFAGNLAVCLFFVLSGFVLSIRHFENYDPLGLQGDALKRYIRLALPAAASIVFAGLLMKLQLIHPLNVSALPNPWLDTHYNFLPTFPSMLKQGLWDYFFSTPPGATSYNSSLWTIQTEFIGSLLVFATVALSVNTRYFAWVCAFMGAVFAQTYYVAFFIGMILAFIYARFSSKIIFHRLFSPVLLLVGIYLGTSRIGPAWPFMEFLSAYGLGNFVVSIGSGLIILAVLQTKMLKTVFASSPLKWLGKVSYSVYLLHIPIIFSLNFYLFSILKMANVTYAAAALGAMAFSTIVILLTANYIFIKIDTSAIVLANKFKKALFKVQ